MHFKVTEWFRDHAEDTDGVPQCPYRILDPATGSIIAHVTEFNDDEGWLRVLCRSPQQVEGQTNFAYYHLDTGEVVSQVLHVPYQVVPYYDGIDDLPHVFIDTIDYNGGRPTGDWIPQDQPYHTQSKDEV